MVPSWSREHCALAGVVCAKAFGFPSKEYRGPERVIADQLWLGTGGEWTATLPIRTACRLR